MPTGIFGDYFFESDQFVNGLGLPFKVHTITSLEFDPLLFEFNPLKGNEELSPLRISKDLVDPLVQLTANNITIG